MEKPDPTATPAVPETTTAAAHLLAAAALRARAEPPPLPAEWAAWLQDGLGRGCDRAEMGRALAAAGFDSRLAIACDVADEPALGPRPEPDLRANTLFCGDRRVRLLAQFDRPQLLYVDGLLDDAECDALVLLARDSLLPSTVVDDLSGANRPDPQRSSRGCVFARGHTALIAALEQRIARLLAWPVSHGEGLQVLCYPPGAEYRAHMDWFDPAKPGGALQLQRGGQRVGSLVIYLTEPEAGGGTRFPQVGLELRPRRGAAVYFANVDAQGRPDPASLHGGLPVLKGVKFIATKWLRERPFA